MSAIRSTRRSAARASISSPYARPAPKKSSWSITTLLSYFNPLRLRSQSAELAQEDDSESDPELDAQEHGRSAADALSTRGHQISNTLKSRNIAERPPAPVSQQYAPPQPSASSASSPSPARVPVTSKDLSAEPTTPREGLDIVTSFLDSHRGQPISSIEAEGLISLIKKSAPAEQHEVFRFSSTPSTPLRGNSPVLPSVNSMPFQFSASSTSLNGISSPNSTPSKLLKHNPNGRYRWEGAGSAKHARSRNRFHSPAFGPSRLSSNRLVLKESPEKASEPIKMDTKRRRIGDETSSAVTPSGPSTPPPRSGAPAPSPTRAAHFPFPVSSPNGSFSSSKPTPALSDSKPKINGYSSSTPQLRPPKVLAKPTTPAKPSPLRQAWGQSTTPSPSSKSDSEGSPPQRQTKAANYMAELIKEVTPVRKLDVSNPYQMASPVQITTSARPKARRLRATGKPALPKEVNGRSKEEKSAEKAREYSAQAIIEATVPKGSKRSRAPASIGKLNGNGNGNGLINGSLTASRSPSPPSLGSSLTPQIEEVEIEEEGRKSTKRAKPNGVGLAIDGRTKTSPSKNAPVIEEVEDDEMSGTSTTAPSEVIEVGSKSSAPLNASSSTRIAFGGNLRGSAIPKEPSKLRFSYKPETASPSPAISPAATLPTPESSEEFSLFANAIQSKPSSSTAAAQKKDPKEAALACPVTSLPSFSFSPPIASGSGLSIKGMEKARSVARNTSIESLPQFSFLGAAKASAPPPPVQSFNYGAAGFKAPSSSGAWKCPACMLDNEDAAADKCSICDTSRVAKASAAPMHSFNYSAAGLKAPSSSGKWKCSTCMLDNEDTADKCSTCEAPRATKPATPATQGFNYAAAGLKPPEQQNGKWICSTCGLKNEDTAAKCQICEAPR